MLALTTPALHALTPQDRSMIERALDQGRADDAFHLLQPATAPGTNDADAQQLSCRLSLQLEQWNDAVAACQQAVRLAKDSSNNHLWFGRALGEKADRVSFFSAYGLGKRVRVEFETAVALDPRNAEALSDLGEFYTEAPAIVGGGKDKAVAVAGKLDAVDRSRAEELRGRIAASDKDSAAAEQHFRAAVAATPRPAGYWMVLASFFQRQQSFDRMQDALHSGLAADRAKGTAHVYAARMLTRAKQDPATSIRLLRDYLGSSAKSEEEPAFRVQLFLANLLTQQGDAAGAAQQIQAAAAIASIYHPAKHVATNTGR